MSLTFTFNCLLFRSTVFHNTLCNFMWCIFILSYTSLPTLHFPLLTSTSQLYITTQNFWFTMFNFVPYNFTYIFHCKQTIVSVQTFFSLRTFRLSSTVACSTSQWITSHFPLSTYFFSTVPFYTFYSSFLHSS